MIAMGVVFILGGFRAVTDPRPMVIASSGAQVRPGYSLPPQAGTTSSGSYFGYFAIAAGVSAIAVGFMSNRLFGSAPKSGRTEKKK